MSYLENKHDLKTGGYVGNQGSTNKVNMPPYWSALLEGELSEDCISN